MSENKPLPASDVAAQLVADIHVVASVLSVSDLLKAPGIISMDFADITAVFDQGGGIGVVGVGEASGEGRAVRATEAAIADVKAQLRLLGAGGR